MVTMLGPNLSWYMWEKIPQCAVLKWYLSPFLPFFLVEKIEEEGRKKVWTGDGTNRPGGLGWMEEKEE